MINWRIETPRIVGRKARPHALLQVDADTLEVIAEAVEHSDHENAARIAVDLHAAHLDLVRRPRG